MGLGSIGLSAAAAASELLGIMGEIRAARMHVASVHETLQEYHIQNMRYLESFTRGSDAAQWGIDIMRVRAVGGAASIYQTYKLPSAEHPR